MALYYFDVKDGIVVRDRYGLECDNDRDAIVRGRVIALEVARGLMDPDPHMHISVIHESGREVFRVPASAAELTPEPLPQLAELGLQPE